MRVNSRRFVSLSGIGARKIHSPPTVAAAVVVAEGLSEHRRERQRCRSSSPAAGASDQLRPLMRGPPPRWIVARQAAADRAQPGQAGDPQTEREEPLRAEGEVGPVVDRTAAEALEQRVEALVRWHFVPRRPPIRMSRLSFTSRSRVARLSVRSRPGAWRTALLVIGPSSRKPFHEVGQLVGSRVAGEPVVAASRSGSRWRLPAGHVATFQPPARAFASSPLAKRAKREEVRHAAPSRGRWSAPGPVSPGGDSALVKKERRGLSRGSLAAGCSIRVAPSAARAASAMSS